MQQSTESLPDFIEMTNYCEARGYIIDMIRSRKGITCDLYHNNKLLKVGTIVFKECLDAQQETYTKLYKAISR